MRIISRQQIESLISPSAAIAAVRQGFIDHANGLVELPHPMQILFQKDDGHFFGDCHVKAAQQKGMPCFVIKVASGFYENPDKGLPANNGLMLAFSAETGVPIALLQDEGWLTQMRTAAAGALAAALKPVGPDACLGLIGSGTQAFLQASLITQTSDIRKIAVYTRNYEKGLMFCEQLTNTLDGISAVAMKSAREVCHASDILVTTTPSTSPVITAEDIPDKLHIVAVGADSPGKNEIAPAITAMADILVTDSHEQCLHHGDLGVAVRQGAVTEHSDFTLGGILAGKHPETDFSQARLSLVDLTGIGVQDLAIASLVVSQLDFQQPLSDTSVTTSS